MNQEKLFDQLQQIETENFILREIKVGDENSLFKIYSNHDVIQYLGKEPAKTLAGMSDLISKLAEGFRTREVIRWGIAKKDDNRIIGSCGYHTWVKESFRAEVGFVLNKEYWGKGIMGEVLRHILQFGFEKMGLNRVEALVEPENAASIKLLLKIGFQREGLLKEYEFTKGKFDDLIIFSMLKRDFCP